MVQKTRKNGVFFGWLQRSVCLLLACIIAAGMLPVQAFAEGDVVPAAEDTTFCGIEVHTHEASCYQRDLICSQAAAAAHIHTEGCQVPSQTPTCGLEADEAHAVHSYTCGTLACGLEHIHGDGCYAEPVLNCTEEHEHVQECYDEPVLTCTLEHIHEESCYDLSALTCGFHIHADDCYGAVYTCEASMVADLDTHVHTDSCYSTVSVLICTQTEHTHSLACYSDKYADLETEADWTVGLPTRTGVAAADLIAVAQSQLNLTNGKNKESEINYTVAADGVTKNGYTRYGAWFLDPYMDWNAAFVAFCLHYAGVDIPFDNNYAEWTTKLDAASLFQHSTNHTPIPGEIAFLTGNQHGTSDRAGIVTAVYPDNSLDVIVGDHNNAVATVNVKNVYSEVIGYGLLAPIPGNHWATQGSFGENNCLTWRVEPDGSEYILYISGNGAIPSYAYPGGNYRESVRKLVIEDGVTSIGDGAFSNMHALKEAEIAGSVKYIGYQAFSQSTLSKVVFQEGIEEIGRYAFSYCYSLDEVVFPDSLKTLGDYAFENTYIKSITIPVGIENWGRYVFSNNRYLKNVVIESGVTEIPDGAFYYCESLTSVEIPDSVTRIGNSAFSSCRLLDIPKLPASLTTIGSYAFSGCNITSFFLPESVKTVGDSAFSSNDWTSLTLPNRDITWGQYVFSGNYNLTDLTIAEGVQEIPYGMFSGCGSLSSLDFPTSLTTIHDYAFQGTGFTTVTIFDELTYGKYAYAACQALEKVIIEDGVTSIPEGMFSGLWGNTTTSLTSAELPGSVTSIGADAFSGCPALQDPFKPNTYYSFPEGAAAYFGFTAPLNKLSGNYYADKDGVLWQILEDGNAKLCYIPSDITDYTVGPSIPGKEEGVTHTITGVGADALGLATSLETLGFYHPWEITRLDDRAFANAPALTSINGCTTWSEARKTFVNEKLTVGLNPCQNTKLQEIIVLPEGKAVGKQLEVAPGGNAPGIQITANVGETLRVPSEAEDGTQLCYTGEWVTTQITVTKPNPDYRIRMYVQYSNSSAAWNRVVGDTVTVLNTDGNTELGRVTLLESDVPGIYYYELESCGTDSVWNFSFESRYPNYTAPGETMRVWGVIMTKEEAETLGSGLAFDPTGHKYVSVEWGVKRDEYSYTWNSLGGEMIGSGLGDNTARVSVIGFQGAFDVTDSLGVGYDGSSSITYTAKFILPEGVSWDPKIVEAVKNGDVRQSSEYYKYETDTSITTYYTTQVLLDGQWKTILRCQTPYRYENPSLSFDGNDGIIEWDDYYYCNTDYYRILIFDAFVIENPNRQITIGSQLEVTVNYLHSDPAVHTKTAQVVPTGTPATFELTQSVTGSGIMGTDREVTISATNNGLMEHTGLYRLDGDLSTGYYLKPSSMSELLAGPYDVSITIIDAKLCTPVSETVTGADGQSQVSLSTQNAGTNTTYFGRASEDAAGCCTAAYARIELVKAADGVQLLVSRNGYGTPDTITTVANSGPAIEAALNAMGFVVAPETQYSIRWSNMAKDGEVFHLYGGQTQVLASYTATCKDTFMLLGSDILRNYADEQKNQNIAAEAWPSVGWYLDSTTTTLSIYRDLSLTKTAYVNGKWTEYAEVVAKNQTVPYRVHIQSTTNRNDILPVVERIDAGQELLVPAAQNPHLANEGLPTTWYRGMAHYRLNQAGNTYYNVYVGGYYAHSVAVGERETIVHWYFTDVSAGNLFVDYATYTNFDNIFLPEGVYRIANETWLNDHQSHRLWTSMVYVGANIYHDLHIVTDKSSAPSKDALASSTFVSEGNQVTYRMNILTEANTETQVQGSDIYLKLPAIVPPAGPDGWCWSKENISISYVTEGGVRLTNPNDWQISSTHPGSNATTAGQYYIRWSDDFTAKFFSPLGLQYTGKVYAYVTLTFPEGADWDKYTASHGSKVLECSFVYNEMAQTVNNELRCKGYPYLQIGVYTGVNAAADNPNKMYSRQYYDNGSSVTYYVAVYNSGGSRLYLDDIRVELPEGFESAYNNSVRALDALYGNEVKAKFVDGYVTYDYEMVDNHYVLTYSLTPYNRAADARGKYCLLPGEYMSFTFQCQTNSREETEDVAQCKASMPYFDYNGSGAEVAQNVSVTLPDATRLQNSGSCQLLKSGTTPEDKRQTLTSNVSMIRGDILPGVTTKPTGVIVVDNNLNETMQVYPGYAQPHQTIQWTTDIHNQGLYSMFGYTITQTVEAPYSFVKQISWDNGYCELGERYTKDGQVIIPIRDYNGDYHDLILNGDPVTLTYSRYWGGTYESTIQISTDKNENEVLTIHVMDGQILVDQPAQLIFYTKNLTQKASGGIHFCEAMLTPSPDQDYDGDLVVKGHNVTDDQGKNLGVWNNSSFMIASELATTAWMSVSDDAGSSISSSADTRHIMLEDESADLRYTMTMRNERNVAIQKLVFINTLPGENDHGPFSELDKRYSDFAVSLADDPEFTVTMTRNGVTTTLDPAQYTIEYTTQTSFTQADWAGEADASKWTAVQPGNGLRSSVLPVNEIRAIRVILRNQDGTAIIPGIADIAVGYNAVIPENESVSSGETAWNSFGYEFTTVGSSFGLGAAPQSVGVRIPYAPILEKELSYRDGEDYCAETDEAFSFQIYSGTSATPTTCTFATVTVPEGSNSSEITLDGLKVYRMVDGEWTITDSDWTWVHGTTYTVTEVDCDEDFFFGKFNNNTAQTYTFVYNSAVKNRVICTNYTHDWAIELYKTDADDHSVALRGAAFGLYSPNAEHQVNVAEAMAAAALPENIKVSPTVTYDGTVYYLTGIAKTDDLGNCEWNKLMEDRYVVVELKAPMGYKLDSTPHCINRNGDTTVITTIENARSYEMPMTGGEGTGLFLGAGTLLILASLMGACVLWLKRRRQNARA